MARVVGTTGFPTKRQVQACAPFGIWLEAGGGGERCGAVQAAEPMHAGLGCGEVGWFGGPSGCGKSSAMRSLAGRLDRDGTRALVHRCVLSGETRVIDLLGESVSPIETLGELASFGLGEPALMARRVGELSEGQRHRAELARLFHDARRTRAGWILIDEFASVLDRITAKSLGAAVRRAARRCGVRVVCASAHDDVLGFLEPAMVCRFELDGSWLVEGPDGNAPSEFEIVIESGTAGDMDRLLPYHYVGGKPATRVGVVRAFDRAHRVCAGVLVVSMPTLNGGWREQAWPGRYIGGDRKAAAARINGELRCISRVIVDPRYRGLGVATRLVRAYLDCPFSQATEAVAALGGICPFFERAGMVAYRVAANAADARLADAIEAAGFEPWMLAHADRAKAIVEHRLIESELVRWCKMRRVETHCMTELSRLAGARLCVKPMAYAAVSPPECVVSAVTRERWGVSDAKRRGRAGEGRGT